MTGWRIALVAAVCAFAALWYADYMSERAAQAEGRLEAVLAGQEAQRKINKEHDAIDKGLKDGGQDGLSDYMRGAADKLWPAP